MSDLYLSSNIAIAAKDPEPMVTKSGHSLSQCVQRQWVLKEKGMNKRSKPD